MKENHPVVVYVFRMKFHAVLDNKSLWEIRYELWSHFSSCGLCILAQVRWEDAQRPAELSCFIPRDEENGIRFNHVCEVSILKHTRSTEAKVTYFTFHISLQWAHWYSVFHLSVYLSCSNARTHTHSHTGMHAGSHTHTWTCTSTHMHKDKVGKRLTQVKDPGQESRCPHYTVCSKLSTKGQRVNILGFTITISITTTFPCQSSSKSAKGNM